MTLQEQLKQAEKELFEAEMNDCIGGHKLISAANNKVNAIKKQIAEESSNPMIEEIKSAITGLWRASKISTEMYMKAIANTDNLYEEATNATVEA